MIKKKSIREFVSEESIKYQIYVMKYSKLLQDMDNYTFEELEKRHNSSIDKKIRRYRKELLKEVNSSTIAQESIKKNIKYIKNLKLLHSKEQVQEEFKEKTNQYIKELELRISENKKGTLELDKELLIYAKNIVLIEDISKEKFGTMILLIIKNLGSMPGFSGYTDNWKTDFYSNAVEDILNYLSNFDENLLSKRTGLKSKAFAYITQISFNAFVKIINERKKEDELLKDTISLESANLDGTKTLSANNSTSIEKKKKRYKIKNITSDNLEKSIKEAVEYINKYNDIIENNALLDIEIKEYNNYKDGLQLNELESIELLNIKKYIEKLKAQYINLDSSNKICILEVLLAKNTNLGNWLKPEEYKDIDIVINSYKKKKKEKTVIENNIPSIEVLTEFNKYTEEW